MTATQLARLQSAETAARSALLRIAQWEYEREQLLPRSEYLRQHPIDTEPVLVRSAESIHVHFVD